MSSRRLGSGGALAMPVATWALVLLLALQGCTDDVTIPDDMVFGLPDSAYWPDNSTYPGVEEGRILITNNGDDTVTVLDLQTFDIVANVAVGLIPVEREGPHHVAASPDGLHYYVGISNYVPGSGSGPHGAHGTGTADGYALKVRGSDNVTIASTRVDRSPGDVRLTPDGSRLLMTHFDLLRLTEELPGPVENAYAALAILDTDSFELLNMTMICPAPHGLLPNADGSRAYAACYGSDELAVIDFDDNTIPTDVELVPLAPDAGTPPFTAYDPYAVTVSPTDGGVYISSWLTGDVLYFDPVTGAMDPARRIFFGTGLPGFGDFTSDGAELFIPRQGPDLIARIDPNTTPPTVIEEVGVPAECFALHLVKVLPGDTHAAVVCEGDHVGPGAVALWNLTTNAFERVVEVGVFPDDAQILRTGGGL